MLRARVLRPQPGAGRLDGDQSAGRLYGLSFCTTWRRIRTNNGLENLNRQIRRRTRVVGIFPNTESALRLHRCRRRFTKTGIGKQYLSLVDFHHRRIRSQITLSQITEKQLLSRLGPRRSTLQLRISNEAGPLKGEVEYFGFNGFLASTTEEARRRKEDPGVAESARRLHALWVPIPG